MWQSLFDTVLSHIVAYGSCRNRTHRRRTFLSFELLWVVRACYEHRLFLIKFNPSFNIRTCNHTETLRFSRVQHRASRESALSGWILVEILLNFGDQLHGSVYIFCSHEWIWPETRRSLNSRLLASALYHCSLDVL